MAAALAAKAHSREHRRRQARRGHAGSPRLDGRCRTSTRLREDVRKARGRPIPWQTACSPRKSSLAVGDLGRVELAVGDRQISLSAMRRKPASVLVYLVTKPQFAANREQVVDALWPDSDPASATNNLNQSLFYLRRSIDPWYEDDVSVDYVGFQGDVIWLDHHLVSAASADFVHMALGQNTPVSDLVASVLGYPAPFAPEFEYEEWAMCWRARVHSTFLAGQILRSKLSSPDKSFQPLRTSPPTFCTSIRPLLMSSGDSSGSMADSGPLGRSSSIRPPSGTRSAGGVRSAILLRGGRRPLPDPSNTPACVYATPPHRP